MILTITYHQISPHFAKKSLPKIVSPNSPGFPGFPPRFSVVGDTSTLKPFDVSAMKVKVPLARSTKHVMWRVCRWWSVRCNEKSKKNNQQMTNQWQWTEPTTPKKNGTQPSFFWWFGLVEGYEPKNVEEKRLLSGLVGTKKLSEREIPCPSWRCR